VIGKVTEVKASEEVERREGEEVEVGEVEDGEVEDGEEGEGELQMLYTEQIIDRYRHPKNFGEMKDFTVEAEEMNSICGDRIKMQLKIKSGTVDEAKYSGEGCSISQASADLLADFIAGKNLDELRSLEKEDMLKILGIEVTAMRLKCALLPLKVLKLNFIKVEFVEIEFLLKLNFC